VTVYEASWRLGGKLASGRNRQHALRNEEHGLHVWFGCYENAFRLAREVYEQWQPPRGSPLRSLDDAFLPHHFTPLGYEADDEGGFAAWSFFYPRDTDRPGLGSVSPSVTAVLARLVDGLAMAFGARPGGRKVPGAEKLARLPWRRFASARDGAVASLLGLLGAKLRSLGEGRRLGEAEARRLHALATRLRAAARALIALGGPTRSKAMALSTPIDFLLTALCGVLDPRYGILEDGDLDRINHLDLREWLRDNGARDETLESPHVRTLYDTCFQYEDGDVDRPRFEAGTALRIFLRLHFTYKGAVLYLVRGGMGETFVSPLYEVLVARGVRFELDHTLESLELSPETPRQRPRGTHDAGRLAERLVFSCTRDERVDEPTFVHRGLVLWPSAPGVDPPGARGGHATVLERGRDFDDVVLALSAGAMAPRPGGRSPCEALLAHSPPLRAFFDHLSLVPTLVAQLWVNRDLPGLGWDRPPPALVGCGRPLDVWVDMSHVLDLEAWPAEARPRGVHYFCGVVRHPGAADARDREGLQRVAETLVAEQLERRGGDLWPKATTADGRFDWSVLHDAAGREGAARLRAQYVHANVEPSDLCDISVPGTSRLRPDAHESGLENVALCGTWTRTGFDTTCVEGAVMAGLAAARVVAGEGRTIIGEGFLRRPVGPPYRVPGGAPAVAVEVVDAS
jgi:uncharacterized protein with NAD-binding domain and iron-sulfur cluster